MKRVLIIFIYITVGLLLFASGVSAKQKQRFYLMKSTGIVIDTKTDLEWKVGPDKDMNWHEAKAWVGGLTLDGGGWRVPTLDELEGLYEKGASRLNMTPLLKTTGWQVWSCEMRDSSFAWGFYFCRGGRGWDACVFPYNFRAFAVRARSDR